MLFVPMPEKYLAEGANLESDELIREMAYEPGIYAMAGRNLRELIGKIINNLQKLIGINDNWTISGYRAGTFQLALVPDRDTFSSLLRALKVWAKSKSNLTNRF